MPSWLQWIASTGATGQTTAPVQTMWVTPTQTMAATSPIWASNSNVWWNNQNQTAASTTGFYDSQAALYGVRQQQRLWQQQIDEYTLFRPAAPVIITRQDEARMERAAYRRAIDEHDQQETARLLRLIQAREESAEAQRLILEQRQAEQAEQRERRRAASRAQELLMEHLTSAQRKTFIDNGWFIVEGGRTKTRYRINARGAAGNIDVLHGERLTHRLCCHAAGHIPLGDQWLSQKIMLELAEDDFLRLANRHAA